MEQEVNLNYLNNSFFKNNIDKRILSICENYDNLNLNDYNTIYKSNQAEEDKNNTSYQSANNSFNNNISNLNNVDNYDKIEHHKHSKIIISDEITELNKINSDYNVKQDNNKEDENINNNNPNVLVFSNMNYKNSKDYHVKGIKIEQRNKILRTENNNILFIEPTLKPIKIIINDTFNSNDYYLKDKYKDEKLNPSCFSCIMKNKINKKYSTHLKENFKLNKSDNELILQLKDLINKKQYLEAYRLSSKYFKITSNNPNSDILFLFGNICKQLNRKEEAKDIYLKCLLYDFFNPKVYFNLGLIYLEESNFIDALTHMTKYNSLDNNAISNYHLSLINYNLTKFRNALNNINQAINKLEEEHEGNLYLKISNKPLIEKYYSLRIKIYVNLDMKQEESIDINFLKGLTLK